MTRDVLNGATCLLAAGRAADAEAALGSIDPSELPTSERAEHSLLLARIFATQPHRLTLAKTRATMSAKLAQMAGRDDLAREALTLERSLEAAPKPYSPPSPGQASTETLSFEDVERRAIAAVAEGRAGDAVRLLAAADEEFCERGEYAASAKALLAKALAMGRAGEGSAARTEVLESAVNRGRYAGDTLTELKSQRLIVQIWEEEQDWTSASGELKLLLERVTELASGSDIVDCQRHLARLELYSGRPSAALVHAELAVEAAARTGDVASSSLTRIERSALRSLAVLIEREHEGFADLRVLAEYAGLTGHRWMVDLQEAAEGLQAGRVEAGLAAAESGRVGALAALDLLAFVQACLLIAEGRNRQADRVGVREVLQTCKTTLELHRGKEAGRALVAVLDSLPSRLQAEDLGGRFAEGPAHERSPSRSEAPMEVRIWDEDPHGDAVLGLLFDGDRSLPPGTTLVIDRDAADFRSASLAYRAAAAVMGLLVLALAMAAPDVLNDPWVSGRYLFASVVLGAVLLVVALERAARRRVEAAKDAAAGRWRCGAFLREDVLVLRFCAPLSAFTYGGVFPWELVEGASTTVSGNSSSRYRRTVLHLRYRPAPGAPVSTVELDSFNGDTARRLSAAIQERLRSHKDRRAGP